MFQSFSDTIVRVISDVFKFGESDNMDCTPTAPLPRSSLWLWWTPYRSFEGESLYRYSNLFVSLNTKRTIIVNWSRFRKSMNFFTCSTFDLIR